MSHYGARPEAWEDWLALGVGEDLLPSVANPNAKLSPNSTLGGVGKVPSIYNHNREVVGIAKWTQMRANATLIEHWRKQPDYALSVQTRALGAGDVDVADPKKAAAIREALADFLPGPIRYRTGTGKFLIPFKRSFAMPKRVLPVDGGMIELLGDGQQFIADGYHSAGMRYEWEGDIAEMVELSEERFEQMCAMLAMCFGIDWPADKSGMVLKGWKIAREKRDVAEFSGRIERGDEVCEWLTDNWTVHDVGADGQLFIECPFAVSHSTDSGPTSTAYFPAGTGGYEQGHFVCLHAHCAGREDRDYLDASGYSAAQFADLVGLPAVVPEADGGDQVGQGERVEAELVWPELKRDKKGILPTQLNLFRMCVTPHLIKRKLAFDTFKDELVWAPWAQADGEEQWRTFSDVDYAYVRMELEMRGVNPMGHELLRSSIAAAAVERSIDTAQEWLSRLQWDGVERLDVFCSLAWGWGASDYSRAVGKYIWTALAGRVITPGCQADMAPILVGAQGARKTSAIKAMAPSEDFYVTIPLDAHDDDTSRRLRGKLVGELEELRGLNSRHIEEIKAWITRTTEGWIPKYKEFESLFKRRLIFFGTTNDDEFLNDPTGERRWLPGVCGDLDVEWIKDNREQLWAEGAAKYRLDGIAWREAELLAKEEHHLFKVTDSWEPSVMRWLKEKQINGQTPEEVGHVTTSEALAGAVSLPVGQHDKSKEMRMGKVLRAIGWERRRIMVGEARVWAYVPKEQS